MSKSLMEITSHVNALEQMLIESGGELTEAIEKALAVKDVELPEKVDGYSFTIERLEAIEEFYSNKAKQYSQAAKSLSNAQATIKERIKFAMKEMNIDELVGNEVKFKLSKSKPKLVIDDEKLISKDYKTEVISVELQKDKLLEDLKIGEIPGAHLEESFSLRTYVNKGGKK